jgi:ankyrin repeat protein
MARNPRASRSLRAAWVLSVSAALVAGSWAGAAETVGALGQSLIDAVRSDDQAAVAALLTRRADVNAREVDGATALAWAALRSNAGIARLLLDAGANPNLTNELGIGPLSLAITNGSTAIVELLLDKRADPNAARENGETVLMTAARLGQVDVMKMLLDRGANPNASDRKFGQTALMWAAGTPAAVRLLVDRGADLSATTATWDVKATIYTPVVGTLGKTGIPWNTDGEFTSKRGGLNPLLFAVQKLDLESARILVDAGLEVNRPAADGTTPLLAALYKWNSYSAVFVPGRGAPAPPGSSARFSPDLPMARFLLDRGANVNVADSAGYTPLHGAVLAVASLTRVGFRGRRGGDVLSRNENREASGANADEALAMVKRLLDAGADPNRQTIYPTPGPAGDVRINPAPPGSSAFHIAAASNSLALVKMLADFGANPNLVRKDGHTPFTVAVQTRDLEVVKEMVARGADLSARYDLADKIPDPVESIALPRQNQTILHVAAIAGTPALIEYLHSQGARLDLKNAMGETPLDLADHQERYREARQRENAEGDAERLRTITRQTAATDAIKKLLVHPASRTSTGQGAPRN